MFAPIWSGIPNFDSLRTIPAPELLGFSFSADCARTWAGGRRNSAPAAPLRLPTRANRAGNLGGLEKYSEKFQTPRKIQLWFIMCCNDTKLQNETKTFLRSCRIFVSLQAVQGETTEDRQILFRIFLSSMNCQIDIGMYQIRWISEFMSII